MYYDKLYEKICDTYAQNRNQYVKVKKKYEGADGVHLTFVASISQEQVHECAYLIDIGEEKRNRISIYISDTVCIKVLDKDGRSNEVVLNIEFGVPQLFQIEFSNDPVNGFLSVFLNNEEILNTQRQDGYQILLSMDNVVIGANRAGQFGACFISGATLMRYKVLGIKERLDFLGYLIHNLETSYGAEYNGSQYMRRNADGHLIQEVKEARPILRESLHYSRL